MGFSAFLDSLINLQAHFYLNQFHLCSFLKNAEMYFLYSVVTYLLASLGMQLPTKSLWEKTIPGIEACEWQKARNWNQSNSLISSSTEAARHIIYAYICVFICVAECYTNVLCVCVKHLYNSIFSNTSQFKSHYYILSSGIITLSFQAAEIKASWNPKYDMIEIL